MAPEPTTSTPARQVVVVRQGPPKRRGAIIDGFVGVLGVALLVLAGVLGQSLPDEDVVVTQYLPEFAKETTDATLTLDDGQFPGQSQPLTMVDQEEITLLVQVPHDNVVSFTMQLYSPGDDIGSSLPDAFSATLYDPDGNQVGEVFKANTAQPKVREDPVPGSLDPETLDNLQKPLYVSGESRAATVWRLESPPEPEFIGGADQQMDHTAALSIAIDKYTKYTNGTWTLKIKLINAGDCPQPSTSGQQDRYAECQRVTGGTGQDPGNDLTVASVYYDYYTIALPDPQAESTDAI